MKPDDRIRLQHIADALETAVAFTEGKTRTDLDTDNMLTFALVHAIQIVGEAAAKIGIEVREKHPQIPWALIIGMRNRLVHAYFDINHDILWETATEAAPALLERVIALLKD